jgi:hypothetical protein
VFVIGSDGYFSGVTDYGSAAYWWSHHGRKDFREFLLTAAVEWNYFMRKLFPDWERYDGKATLQEAKAYIIRRRFRDNACSRKEAREAWDELMDEFEGLEHEWMYTNWVLNSQSSKVVEYYERSEMRRTRPYCHAKAFVTKAMARLADLLKRELEDERAQAIPADGCPNTTTRAKEGDTDGSPATAEAIPK